MPTNPVIPLLVPHVPVKAAAPSSTVSPVAAGALTNSTASAITKPFVPVLLTLTDPPVPALNWNVPSSTHWPPFCRWFSAIVVAVP